MKRGITLALLAALALGIAVPIAIATANNQAKEDITLKEAKIIIEHNATDEDTGFQGFIDSEGWRDLTVRGPGGLVLSLSAKQELAKHGVTELFFETVEPANADVAIEDVLAVLPPGEYNISGIAIEDGEIAGKTFGTALLTHTIPAGPELLTPAEGAEVGVNGVVMSWNEVTQSIDGEPVEIIAYQLIVEKDEEPGPNMIGKFGLSMYLPPDVTSITLPDGFLEPGETYSWEVLAIEVSGNQTLSSAEFETAE